MKLKKWTALALSAALATCMLTGCPWDEDDAASSDLSASSSRPSHDGGSDEDDSGSTGGGTGGETAVNQYTVTVTIGANGTVTYNNNTYSDITNKTVQVDEGTMLTFTVMPEEKYTVTVTAGGTTLNPTNGVYSYTVNADCNITVKFEDLGYTITTDENGKETYNVHDETGLKAWAKAAETNPSANCTLANDLNLTDQIWQPIGNYTGIFDGNNKTITGLTADVAMFRVYLKTQKCPKDKKKTQKGSIIGSKGSDRMTIHRYEVTDAEWDIIEPMLPKHHMGRPQKDLRAHFNGILWIARSGARWEDLPARYGPHQTVYSCFCRWRDDGTLERIFHALGANAELEELNIDSTTSKVSEQASRGPRKR